MGRGMRRGFVYVVASKSGTLYVGVTGNLDRRVRAHKDALVEGFTKTYGCNRLLYFEEFADVRDAIVRETQLKGWRREKKIALLEKKNPGWVDLAAGWGESFLK